MTATFRHVPFVTPPVTTHGRITVFAPTVVPVYDMAANDAASPGVPTDDELFRSCLNTPDQSGDEAAPLWPRQRIAAAAKAQATATAATQVDAPNPPNPAPAYSGASSSNITFGSDYQPWHNGPGMSTLLLDGLGPAELPSGLSAPQVHFPVGVVNHAHSEEWRRSSGHNFGPQHHNLSAREERDAMLALGIDWDLHEPPAAPKRLIEDRHGDPVGRVTTVQTFHTDTQTRDGVPGLIVDPGSIGNLAGSRWSDETDAYNKANGGTAAVMEPRPVDLRVMGVGHGSQACSNNVRLPVDLTSQDGSTMQGTYDAPVVNGSQIPGLLGLHSMEASRGILDMREGHQRLILCGPDSKPLVPGEPFDLGTGSRILPLKKAPSGHLILPISRGRPVERSLMTAEVSGSAQLPTPLLREDTPDSMPDLEPIPGLTPDVSAPPMKVTAPLNIEQMQRNLPFPFPPPGLPGRWIDDP